MNRAVRPEKSSSKRLIAVATLGLLTFGVATATAAGVIFAISRSSDAEAAARAPDEANAPSAGDDIDTDRPIEELADPDWLSRTAESTGIGERALAAYAGASLRLSEEKPSCGIGWNTLAAIGQVESEHGTIDGAVVTPEGDVDPGIIGIPLDGRDGVREIPDTDGGDLDGDTTWDRAVGPMQFLPSTWADHAADGNGDNITDPQHIDDAVLAAGNYLCDVDGDLREPEAWIVAVSAYNEGSDYNQQVADLAQGWVESAA